MGNSGDVFQPAFDGFSESVMVEEAITCIERFTKRFNSRDLQGMDALLHFPHIILSGEKLVIWDAPGQLAASFFDDLATDGWARSTYQRKQPILVSPRKV